MMIQNIDSMGQSNAREIEEIDSIIERLRGGEKSAQERLAQLSYERLRSIASRIIGPQYGNPSLGPTALVGEGFAKLLSSDVLETVVDAKHFFCLFARAMRQSLIDYKRMKKTEKRGGQMRRIELEVVLAYFSEGNVDIDGVSEAMDSLQEKFPRAAKLLEMQCFGFMKVSEMVSVTKLSKSTVESDLRFAKAYVRNMLD